MRVAAAGEWVVGNVFIDRDGTEAAVRGLRAAGGGVGAGVGSVGWISVARVCGRGRREGKVVHALKSHCGYYAACSMSASNAHIAALQELVAEPLYGEACRGRRAAPSGPALVV